MKCPCCNGNIVLDVLARQGNFSVDVKCRYCRESGKVNIFEWFNFKFPPYCLTKITAAFILLTTSTATGIITNNLFVFCATLVVNVTLSTYLSKWWFFERRRH